MTIRFVVKDRKTGKEQELNLMPHKKHPYGKVLRNRRKVYSAFGL